jgi:hypothetical protein
LTEANGEFARKRQIQKNDPGVDKIYFPDSREKLPKGFGGFSTSKGVENVENLLSKKTLFYRKVSFRREVFHNSATGADPSEKNV